MVLIGALVARLSKYFRGKLEGALVALLQGADALNRLGSGDVIVSAKLLEGADKLVRPAAAVASAQ